jgi:hypothetical protein
MISPTFEMLNQRGTPMFFSDTLANRPAAAIVGRIFVSTDTFDLYRDTGTSWDLLSPSTGGITGTGTPFKYPVFDAATNITDGSIEQFTTENVSTKDFFIETSSDDGILESTLKLTNRYFGTPDTMTFEYGRTILAGAPFLRIQDNFATFPTSKILFGNGLLDIQDTTFSVNNSLSNNSYFYGVDPNLNIVATGLTNGATITLAASLGPYAGTIRTGSALNTLQFQTGANVNRLTIGSDGYANFTYKLSVGSTLASSTFNAVRVAAATISRTNAAASIGFGETGADSGLLLQQLSGSPFAFALQVQNNAGSNYYPLSLNPLGGQVLINASTSYSANYEFQVTGDSYLNGKIYAVACDAEIRGTGTSNATSVLKLFNSAGTQMLSFNNSGRFFLGQGTTSPWFAPFTTSTAGADLTGTNLMIEVNPVAAATTLGAVNISGGSTMTQTSGSAAGIVSRFDFSPTSGNATYTSFRINPVINQTGGASGITRGIYIQPTLTAVADYRALEISSGIAVFGASTTAKASIRIPTGVAPTSPVNGDIWFDGTNIFIRVGAVTKQFTIV